MNTFDSLPDIVIRSIYRFSITENDRWRQILVYVSICSHWRTTLMPSVYHRVRFEQIDRSEVDLSDSRTGMEQGVWDSDVNLARMMKAVHHVRTIVISIKTKASLLDFIKNYATYFDIPFEDWSGITHLLVSTSSVRFSLSETLPATASASELAAAMYVLFPNVSSFHSGTNISKHFSNSFCCKMVQALSSSLRSISAEGEIKFSPDIQFNNLTYIRITLPEVPPTAIFEPNKLTYLSLSRLPADFSWSMFRMSDNSVCFDNLAHISLKFRDNSSVVVPDAINVQFPKLRELHSLNLPSGQNLFNSCTFSDCLSTVHVVKSPGLLSQIEDSLDLASSSLKELNIRDNRGTGASYSILNRYFGVNPILPNTSLVISLDFELDIDTVSWVELTSLTFGLATQFGYFATIISKLPKLRYLAVMRVLADNMASVYPHIDIDKDPDRSSVLPISMSLMDIRLGEMMMEQGHIRIKLVMYLLRRLPNITVFRCAKIPQEELEVAIAESKGSFPHLGKLRN